MACRLCRKHLARWTSSGRGSSLLHARADLYPDPDALRPERFPERQFSPPELIPFGGGVRRCLGTAFAPYETKVVLEEPSAIVAILRHLGLPTEAPPLARARDPAEMAFGFE